MKKWKLPRPGIEPGSEVADIRFWDLSTKWSQLHLEEELALFCCQKRVGGLGPGVSALPMGPVDVLENYIFEISVKNWKNEPEENFLEGFFDLTVSKKRGAEVQTAEDLVAIWKMRE